MSEEQVQQEEMTQEEQETTEAMDKAFKDFVHHQRVALEELGKALESLLPKEFREHTKNAGQAFIDAFKSLFDAAKGDLDHMMKWRKDEDSDEGAEKAEASTKVKVEIE